MLIINFIDISFKFKNSITYAMSNSNDNIKEEEVITTKNKKQLNDVIPNSNEKEQFAVSNIPEVLETKGLDYYLQNKVREIICKHNLIDESGNINTEWFKAQAQDIINQLIQKEQNQFVTSSISEFSKIDDLFMDLELHKATREMMDKSYKLIDLLSFLSIKKIDKI